MTLSGTARLAAIFAVVVVWATPPSAPATPKDEVAALLRVHTEVIRRADNNDHIAATTPEAAALYRTRSDALREAANEIMREAVALGYVAAVSNRWDDRPGGGGPRLPQ